MNRFLKGKKYIVLTGNYGSGKTEIALNLAQYLAKKERTTLVDLDIVNPYFRSGEKAQELEEKDIRVLMPTFAMSTVDIPALPPEIQSVFDTPCERVVFDVGGDDTGAAALGRYNPSFLLHRDETLSVMVVNCMRPLTETKADILDLARRIGMRGRLGIDMLINNTNLADRTEPDMIEIGEKTVLECADEMNIPYVINTGLETVLKRCQLQTPAFPINRKMLPEWMMDL